MGDAMVKDGNYTRGFDDLEGIPGPRADRFPAGWLVEENQEHSWFGSFFLI